jgi:hypothetical protein
VAPVVWVIKATAFARHTITSRFKSAPSVLPNQHSVNTATNHDFPVPDLVYSNPRNWELIETTSTFCFEKWSLDPRHGQLWYFFST